MLGFLDALAFLSFRLRNQLGDHCLPILQTHAETLGAAVLGVMVFEATELKDGGFGQVDCVTRPGETGFPGGGRVDDLADVCHEACLFAGGGGSAERRFVARWEGGGGIRRGPTWF